LKQQQYRGLFILIEKGSLIRRSSQRDQENHMADDYFTPVQVADRQNVTPQGVLEWLRQGRLVGHKFGRLWRVHADDLQAFIQAAREAGHPAGGMTS
jgi:excisionase family DNA binding protein